MQISVAILFWGKLKSIMTLEVQVVVVVDREPANG